MTLGHYLFGFSGRINRAKQWAVLLVSLVHNVILVAVFAGTVGFGVFLELYQKKTTIEAAVATPQARAFGIVFAVLFMVGLYIGLAVATKRLHDRNKSGWWLLVFFALPFVLNVPVLLEIPVMLAHVAAAAKAALAGLPPPRPPLESPLSIVTRGAATIVSLWAFVELYIFKGTEGPNRYGPDPLAPRA